MKINIGINVSFKLQCFENTVKNVVHGKRFVHLTGSSSSSSEDDVILLSDTESDFSDEDESVIMLTCPEHQQPRSVSALRSVLRQGQKVKVTVQQGKWVL